MISAMKVGMAPGDEVGRWHCGCPCARMKREPWEMLARPRTDEGLDMMCRGSTWLMAATAIEKISVCATKLEGGCSGYAHDHGGKCGVVHVLR